MVSWHSGKFPEQGIGHGVHPIHNRCGTAGGFSAVWGVPTRTSVYENPDIIAQSPNLEYVYQALKEAVYRPRIKQWTEITVTLGTELDNAVQGAKSVDDALKDAQTACEQIMKN